MIASFTLESFAKTKRGNCIKMVETKFFPVIPYIAYNIRYIGFLILTCLVSTSVFVKFSEIFGSVVTDLIRYMKKLLSSDWLR